MDNNLLNIDEKEKRRKKILIEKYSPPRQSWSPVDKALYYPKSIYDIPVDKEQKSYDLKQ